MVDNDDWRIGEDVTNTSYIASGALRNMEDPHNGGSGLWDNGWQPAHMNEFHGAGRGERVLQIAAEAGAGGAHQQRPDAFAA